MQWVLQRLTALSAAAEISNEALEHGDDKSGNDGSIEESGVDEEDDDPNEKKRTDIDRWVETQRLVPAV
jgi:hypothetical protein